MQRIILMGRSICKTWVTWMTRILSPQLRICLICSMLPLVCHRRSLRTSRLALGKALCRSSNEVSWASLVLEGAGNSSEDNTVMPWTLWSDEDVAFQQNKDLNSTWLMAPSLGLCFGWLIWLCVGLKPLEEFLIYPSERGWTELEGDAYHRFKKVLEMTCMWQRSEASMSTSGVHP